MFKARVQEEAFSGKTATAVRQDIYAKAMMMTMCAALAFPIEERVGFILSAPDALVTKQYKPILGLGLIGGLICGFFSG